MPHTSISIAVDVCAVIMKTRCVARAQLNEFDEDGEGGEGDEDEQDGDDTWAATADDDDDDDEEEEFEEYEEDDVDGSGAVVDLEGADDGASGVRHRYEVETVRYEEAMARLEARPTQEMPDIKVR